MRCSRRARRRSPSASAAWSPWQISSALRPPSGRSLFVIVDDGNGRNIGTPGACVHQFGSLDTEPRRGRGKGRRMAVYTDVSAEDLADFLHEYDLGELLSYKGIAEGVENSNFLVHTTRGHYILTLYEKRVAPEDLPFFLALMEHLAARGLNCPQPVKSRTGALLGFVA